MKTTYLTIVFYLFFSFCNAQDDNTKIVEEFIENFNKKDSTATLNLLHKSFVEYWQVSVINKNKREYSKYYSWANIMKEYEEIEIISSKENKVIVNSIYYSDLDRLLGKMPYRCKKIFVLSKNKIIKITSTKNKKYDYYQNKRESEFIGFKNWLRTNYSLKRSDFKINKTYAIKMRKFIFEFLSENEIAQRD